VRKEFLLLLASVAATLAVALGLIRWLAPGLLGVPADLALVQVDRKLPPFYEGIFRSADLKSEQFLLQDPLTRVRARPFYPPLGGMGPHDLLGFRNRSVPRVADIVVIGDSQTYGNNAAIDDNWPSRLGRGLGGRRPVVYNMSVGGWGAVQYLYMFTNATVLQPHVVIVAFYTGNDPLESFAMAYGSELWAGLRPDPALRGKDAPAVTFPAPESEWWPVTFEDGTRTVFTPTLRLASNQDHPAVDAGYAIMAAAARRISELAGPFPLQLVFTVIPTKELAYARKVARDGLAPPPDYRTLVRREQRHIEQLAGLLDGLPKARYVDVVGPLQEAALGTARLYPENINGHPLPAGYGVIARALARVVGPLVPEPPRGLVAVRRGGKGMELFLVSDEGAWPLASPRIAAANGWSLKDIPVVPRRAIEGMMIHTVLDRVDPKRFGKAAVLGR